MKRGEIWWVSLPPPSGSGPGYRRPALIISANAYNESRINTVTIAVLTSNLRLAAMPGNVRLSIRDTGLDRSSVANVSQIFTIDKTRLTDHMGMLPAVQMQRVDDGLRLALAL